MSSSVKIPGINNVDIGRYKQRIVQYFWDPEPRNDEDSDSPIWCLGRQYRLPVQACEGTDADHDAERESSPDPAASRSSLTLSVSQAGADANVDDGSSSNEQRSNAEDDRGWPSDFLSDFESKFWLTYRSGFPVIEKSSDPDAATAMSFSVRLRSQLVEPGGFSSDTGWGCMIRSGQMLLANTLSLIQLGRDWRRGSKADDERRLLSLFSDDPRAPFSIHRFVEHGASACGKHPGEWFGPSATAECIKALLEKYPDVGLKVYVTGNGSDVHEREFFEVARPDGDDFMPTLILVGIRLGIDRVTPVYWESLKSSLQIPQSVGIAGGRPSSSHYFIGVQGHHLFYLDPHQTRPALPFHERIEEFTELEINSCHTRRLRRLHLEDLDPSMLMGFLIRSEAEWKTWKDKTNHAQSKPIVRIVDSYAEDDQQSIPREEAVDEVETFDDDDDTAAVQAA